VDTDAARQTVGAALAELDLPWAQSRPGVFTVTLPGTRKLTTECAIEVGRHGVGFRAFVVRHPEQDHARVYRWLLERNLKLDGVAFSVDHLGDVYLVGRISLAAVTAAEVDRLLGSVADAADSAFNPVLEMGFADSIRAEWAWRRSRGEPTANLEAFRSLDPGVPDP
jgi:hypothetical protein